MRKFPTWWRRKHFCLRRNFTSERQWVCPWSNWQMQVAYNFWPNEPWKARISVPVRKTKLLWSVKWGLILWAIRSTGSTLHLVTRLSNPQDAPITTLSQSWTWPIQSEFGCCDRLNDCPKNLRFWVTESVSWSINSVGFTTLEWTYIAPVRHALVLVAIVI